MQRKVTAHHQGCKLHRTCTTAYIYLRLLHPLSHTIFITTWWNCQIRQYTEKYQECVILNKGLYVRALSQTCILSFNTNNPLVPILQIRNSRKVTLPKDTQLISAESQLETLQLNRFKNNNGLPGSTGWKVENIQLRGYFHFIMTNPQI